MARKGRKLTPAQRAVALRNLAKARAARKRTSAPARKTRKKRTSKPLTARKRRALGYTKERTMARKKRRSTKRKGGRRSGGGRGGSFLSGISWENMAGAGAYGMLEKQVAEKGEEAWLKKAPLFFEGIGYAGCTAILAHLIGKNVGGIVGKAARHYAAGTFDVAAYKLAKNGKLYESKAEAEAALAGDDGLEGDDDSLVMGLDDDSVGDDEVGYGADGLAGDDD